jgi:hypothetical protein
VKVVIRQERLSIAGRVVDGEGAPVAGAAVTVRRDSSDTRVTSDEDGVFRVEPLPAGSYDLTASTGDGTGRGLLAAVPAGSSEVTRVLQSAGGIEGTVAGFKTAPAVRIQAAKAASATLAPTLKEGRFEMGGLLEGDYVVTAQAPGELAVARVTVTSGARASVRLASAGGGTVTGRVLDFATGSPVTGGKCVVRPRSGDYKLTGAGGYNHDTKIDSAGAFTVATPASDLTVTCFAPGYTGGTAAVTVAPGQTAAVEVLVVAKVKVLGVGFELDAWSTTPRLGKVQGGGAAAEAGLVEGDVIVAVDGVGVERLSPEGVVALIGGRGAGAVVEVAVKRGVTARMVLRN